MCFDSTGFVENDRRPIVCHNTNPPKARLLFRAQFQSQTRIGMLRFKPVAAGCAVYTLPLLYFCQKRGLI